MGGKGRGVGGRRGGGGGVGGGEWVGVSCVGCCSGSVSSSSLAVAGGGGGAGVEDEGEGEGEGGVCGAVGEAEDGGDGGVFSVLGEEGICGVEGGWGRGEGEGVCGVVGGEGGVGGEWGVPSMSCRVVPVCCVCVGKDGEGLCRCLYMCVCCCIFGCGPLGPRHSFGVPLLSGANFPKTLVCGWGLILWFPELFQLLCCSFREGIPLPLQIALGLLQSFFVLFSCWGRRGRSRGGG